MEQVVVNGVISGMNYALMALGLTLIFAIMGVLNFAHGQMYVLGGFVMYFVFTVLGLGYIVGFAASIATLVGVGMIFERFFFRDPVNGYVFEVIDDVRSGRPEAT